ncbi:MAG: outer membrane protein assembly factor BamA [Deltaproteobacteria bacterium]|nr:outer membrane protein assembly factor BamA [Deltaproteobacteria bacterium]
MPFDVKDGEGLSLSIERREAMEAMAQRLDRSGIAIVGIDVIKDMVLKEGRKALAEQDAIAVSGKVAVDFAVLGEVSKSADAIQVSWRVMDMKTRATIASYSAAERDIPALIKAVDKVSGRMLEKMKTAASSSQAPRTGVIGRIEVKGNRRVDAEAVLRKITSKVGEPLSPDDVKDDIRAIYSTGFFDDVSVDLSEAQAGGSTLTYAVKEMPFIRRIAFKGNSELNEDKLKEAITIKANTVLDRAVLASNVDKIKAAYAEKGYYSAAVKPVIETDKETFEAEAAVVFDINEGPEVKIKRITVIGGNHFSEGDVKGHMTTKEAGIFSFLTGSGKFNDLVFQNDLSIVLGKYYDDGYINADILDHRVLLSEDKRYFLITLYVSEGDRFTVGTIDVTGDMLDDSPKEELLGKIKLEKGDTFNRSKFAKGLEAISDIYGDKGYAYADVRPGTRVDAEKKVVDIVIEIKKNELAFVERIDIQGNVRTRDKVIRREVELAEGDLYSSSAMRRSRNNLRRLGYFEDVKVSQAQGGGPDKIKLDVNVKERPTGAVSVGAGYSSVDKVIGTASISQSNLLGTGLRLDLSGTVSATSSKYVLGFTEPWLMDKPLSAGFDVYKTDKDYPDYKVGKTGFDVRFGFPVMDRYTRGTITYRLEDVRIRDVAAGAPVDVKDQEGKRKESSVRTALKRDTRDDAFFPTEGAVASASIEYAGGVIGGSTNYVKYEADAIKYVPLIWDTTVSLRGSAGYVHSYGGKAIPIYERYYLGGINSLRGYRTRSLGPKDTATGAVVGGNKMVLASAELVFPLFPEQGLRGVLFYDIGGAYNDTIDSGDLRELRQGWGVGLRWFSPIGPLRLEFGMPLGRREEEKAHQWDFTIGSAF